MSIFGRRADEPAPAAAPPMRSPIVSSDTGQELNRYKIVGAWVFEEDISGNRIKTGQIDRTARIYIELSGKRIAEHGDGVAPELGYIDATADEAAVLGKKYVLSIQG